MRLLAGLMIAGLLVACGSARAGPDDPANPPLRGQWSKDIHLAGATMNDASVSRTEVPFALPKDKIETIACIEPKLRNVDELNETIGKGGSKCHADAVETDGADVTATGTCQFSEGADTSITGAIAMRGSQAANTIDMMNSIKVSVRSADGQTNQIHTNYRMVWTRLGDCA